MTYRFPPIHHWVRGPVSIAAKPAKRKILGKARVLTPEQFDEAAMAALTSARFGRRDYLFIMLSRYCGLRAKEIASIWFEDVTDATGAFVDRLHVSKRGAKYGKVRTIRMRPEVSEALQTYILDSGIKSGPIFWSFRGEPATSNLVQLQMKRAYLQCGFEGARSHSGRRYVITTMAQQAHTIGATLEDVRIFAGHAHVTTTMDYVEESPNAGLMIGLL